MIINTNIIVLKDSGVELSESYFLSHNGSYSNRKQGFMTIAAQINGYASLEKYAESVSNFLNIDGFQGDDKRLVFDLPNKAGDIEYYFDVINKAHLMKLFPEWDADKLVLTTEPVE